MSFDPIHLWNQMTPIAKGVVVLLIVMSIYSLTVAFERFLYYRKARNQSVAYAKLVTGVPEAGQAPGGDRRFEEVQEQPRRPGALGRPLRVRPRPEERRLGASRATT